MHAIEIEAEIDRNREIHLKLPADVTARKAWVVVLYEDQKGKRSHPPAAWAGLGSTNR